MRRRTLGLFRLAVAALAAAALGTLAWHAGHTPGRGLPNYFSYLTIQSNLLGVVVFGTGGIAALTGRRGMPDHLRGATVLYLILVGAGYWSLVRNEPLSIPWANLVVHGAIPLAAVADWLIAPPREHLTARGTARWLIFPIVYLGYTFIRGPIVHWYPYSVISPLKHGTPAILVTIAGVAVALPVLATIVAWAGNARLSRHRGHQRAV
ncbi:Pr6Pr family membrane protein [Amycolatopsis sp. NPDC059021]|uniref:Pr6Pr family membrane protein n=1 Tax=Amycolatopsis sp. NPDC059021 TaxID=3346704 RepID=UPI00366C3B81